MRDLWIQVLPSLWSLIDRLRFFLVAILTKPVVDEGARLSRLARITLVHESLGAGQMMHFLYWCSNRALLFLD